MPIDWTTIATAATGGFIALSAVVYFLILRASDRARNAEVYFKVLEILQDERVRQARRQLLFMDRKPFSDWSEEEVAQAEIACHTYDTIGTMVTGGMLRSRALIVHWHDSIRKCWERAQPMVDEYRKARGQDYWDDFEHIFRLAVEHERKQGQN